LLPVSVAIAYLTTILLPIGEEDGFSDNALIVLEVLMGTFTVTVVVSAVLVPGAAAHTLLMHKLERRRVSLALRTVVAMILSPLIGAWLLVFAHSDHDVTGWLLYFGSSALFAVASVWYGSRRLPEGEVPHPPS
jgi:MFS family permease